MIVLDEGHIYLLSSLDNGPLQLLTFVKRDTPSEKYPGNAGHYGGTIVQEVLRALIDRMKYVDAPGTMPSMHNATIIINLRRALQHLEARAAERHGLSPEPIYALDLIEHAPTCPICGHLQGFACEGHGNG